MSQGESSPATRFSGKQRQGIRIAAGGVAILVAWVHLLHPEYGQSTLMLFLDLGTIYDPRPPLFVISSVAIFAGILAVFYGVTRRYIYLLGICLMATYIVGYAAWHTVLDHGAFWPHIEPHHHHDEGFVMVLVDHLRADTIALVSKTGEAILLVLLVILYRYDT